MELGIFNEHVTGISPLLDLKRDLVSMFPLDYMHLVCLGVVRKIFISWTSGLLRLDSSFKQKLSENVLYMFTPKEFQKKPRFVTKIDHWKATEFRSFLLYIRPVVLKELLTKEKYSHFLCLNIAVRIMLSEKLNYFET